MTKKKSKRGPGRPRYEFSDKQMETIVELSRMNCNTNTIAEAIGVTDDLLNQRPDITAILRKNRALHRIDVRRGQDEVRADKSQPKARCTMLIWQGKNALGQSDRQQVTGADGGPLSLSIAVTKTYTDKAVDHAVGEN